MEDGPVERSPEPTPLELVGLLRKRRGMFLEFRALRGSSGLQGHEGCQGVLFPDLVSRHPTNTAKCFLANVRPRILVAQCGCESNTFSTKPVRGISSFEAMASTRPALRGADPLAARNARRGGRWPPRCPGVRWARGCAAIFERVLNLALGGRRC